MKIIAHRGASAEAPENTLEAFRLALDIGVDAIEMDIRLSRDGVPVVFHDETLLRIFGTRHRVCDLTAKELGELGVPRLEEVLALKRGETELMLELKVSEVEPIIEAAVGERIVLGSLEPEVVARLPKERRIGIAREKEAIKCYQEWGVDRLAVADALVEMAPTSWVWTVDCPRRAQELEKMGARGIITKDPRALQSALKPSL